MGVCELHSCAQLFSLCNHRPSQMLFKRGLYKATHKANTLKHLLGKINK